MKVFLTDIYLLVIFFLCGMQMMAMFSLSFFFCRQSIQVVKV